MILLVAKVVHSAKWCNSKVKIIVILLAHI